MKDRKFRRLTPDLSLKNVAAISKLRKINKTALLVYILYVHIYLESSLIFLLCISSSLSIVKKQ